MANNAHPFSGSAHIVAAGCCKLILIASRNTREVYLFLRVRARVLHTAENNPSVFRCGHDTPLGFQGEMQKWQKKRVPNCARASPFKFCFDLDLKILVRESVGK